MKRSVIILIAFLFAVTQAKAYHFELNGIYYNFIEGTADEVEVTYPIEYRHDDYDGEGDYYNDIVIPETVIYQNKEYRVTRIGYEAFRESGVEAITIPESIKYIGKEAFHSCSGLKRVEVQWETPLDLSEVDEKYSKLCNDSPSNSEFIFDFGEEYFEDAILIVPKNTKALYQQQYVWKNFNNIEEKVDDGKPLNTREITILDGAITLELNLSKDIDFPCIGIHYSDRNINMGLGTYLEIKKRGEFYLAIYNYEPKEYCSIDKAIEEYLEDLICRFYDDKGYGKEVWLAFVEEGGLQLFINIAKEFIDEEFLNSPFNEIYG